MKKTKFKIKKNSTVSLVISLFNEELVIDALIKELNKLSKKLPKKSEIIFVDDGSQDKTVELLKKSKLQFKKVIIELSRNFGHQSAIIAGLRQATGDFIVSLDADLQHPPKIIPEMIRLHNQGYDVILTKRIDGKAVAKYKQLANKLFYKLINFLSPINIESNSSDFHSLNRPALEALLSMPENQKFLRGMVQWIGFKSIILPFQAGERVAGKSKYNLMSLLKLGLHGLTAFSTRPLYIPIILSIFLIVTTFFYTTHLIYTVFFGISPIDGWSSIILISLIIGSFLSFSMGIIGIYLASIYEETKNRPNYFVEKIENNIHE